jgi:hypothetical protein
VIDQPQIGAGRKATVAGVGGGVGIDAWIVEHVEPVDRIARLLVEARLRFDHGEGRP